MLSTRVWQFSKCGLSILLVLTMLGGMAVSPVSAATVTWVLNADGFWEVATNWSSDPLLPGVSDDVTINVGGNQTITHSSGTDIINSLTSQEAIVLSGGTLTINNASSINNTFTLSGGTLAGAGNVTVSGLLTWTGGGMTDAGITTANGGLTLSGPDVKNLTNGRTLNVAGTTTWTNTGDFGGFIQTGGSGDGVIINNSGTWHDQNAFAQLIRNDYGGTQSTFNNTGTYQKTGAGTTEIAITFNNTSSGPGTGIVDVQSGTLNLSGGGTHTGSFTGAAGGTLEFGGGTHDLSAAASISGANVRFSGGTANIGGSYTASGTTTVTGGTANFNGTVANVGGALGLSNGQANFNNTAGVSFTTIDLSGGQLGGTQSVTASGLFTWTGGGMTDAGITTANGGLTLSGPAVKNLTNGRTLNVAGTTTWTNTGDFGGFIQTGGSGDGVIINNSGTWHDQNAFAQLIRNDYGGTQSTFNNTGTYQKTGAGTTEIAITFNNTSSGPGTGIVDVQDGTLRLGGGGSSNGSFTVAAGKTLEFSGGTYNLNNASAVTSTGRLLMSGATVNTTGTLTNGGSLELTGGLLTADGNINTATYTQSGGTLTGTGTVTVSGAATWSGGQMAGTGTTTIASTGTLTLNGVDAKGLINGRTLNVAGTTTWTNTGDFQGFIQTGGSGDGAIINNSGTWHDQNAFAQLIRNDYGGTQSTFNNTGTYQKTGAGTTEIDILFNNTSSGPGTGVVNVQNGTLRLGGGGANNGTLRAANGGTLTVQNTLTNLSGTTLTGGTYEVLAGGSTATMRLPNANIVTNAATILLDGANTHLLNNDTSADALTDFATNVAAGHFTIQNGRSFTTVGAFSNAGVVTVGNASTFTTTGAFTDSGELQMRGGTFNATSLNNSGEVNGFGTLGVQVANTGTVRAFGGTLNANAGITGASGTVQIDTTGVLALGATSSAGTLIHNGSAPGSLNLGANNITVATNYQNANFGVGNSFNRRANVTGAGQIRAAGATPGSAQTLSGDIAGGGTTSGNATIDLGNVHVGDTVTRNYQIGNANAGGPVLRGAIQTAANGGNITDARLSGSGVTAANFGPIAPGANTGNLAVTFNATSAGALPGQQVHILNNFDNTNAQNLALTGAAFRLAQPSAHTPEPVNLGNVHVGATAQQALSLANQALNDGFSEKLNASIGGATVGVTASGAFTRLNPQATDTTNLKVGLDTTTAGAKVGTATITLQSDGAGTSGLGTTALSSQTVNITGNVFRLADPSAHTPEPVNLGNVHVGVTAQQALSLSNQALNDGFSEKLNANIGGATAGVTATGAFGLLGPQATDTTNLKVGLDTATAGAKVGTATITLQSDGAGTSGLGTTALSSQTVNITGNVFRLAQANALSPVNFGVVHVGDTAQQALSVSNIAANDSFSEKLNASFGGTSDARITTNGLISQLAPGATNNSSMLVGLNTSAAGVVSGTATVHFQSDGAGTSGLGLTNLPSQNVGVSGDIQLAASVFRLAHATLHTPEPVTLGNVHVGAIATQALTIGNDALNDGFSEKLNGSMTTNAPGVITATGSFTLLPPGAPGNLAAIDSTSLVVGINTATAGAKSGTATISLQSDGTGTSGLGTTSLGTQTVTVSGNVFRLAEASAHAPEPVTLGNVHVGGIAQQALSLTNTAANDGFSEKLNASLGGATAGVTATGSFSQLGPQATNNTNLIAGLDTSTAGAKSGTATISLQSDGTGTSDLGTTALSAQTVNITGNVFRLAAASTHTPEPVTLGNVRIGTVATQALTLSNTAPNDGFSEKLNGSITSNAPGVITAGGSFTLLPPGAPGNPAATDSTSLVVGMNTATAGAKNGTATITLASDGTGTSGLGLTALPAQTVNVSGNVFRLADPSAHTPEPVTFANVHVGDIAQQALSLSNQAANDGFSEKLTASLGGATAGVTASGSFSLLGPQATNTTALVVGLDTATAGAKNGTATITLSSDGTGTSGLAALALTPQTVNISGNVFRLAAAGVHTPEPVTFANVHVGETAQQALSLTNTAANDGFSEKLTASLGGATTGVTASGSFSLLGPQATNNTSLIAGLDTATAGAKSGTATITLQSDGTGTSGLGTTALSAQTVTITGNVFRLAQANTLSPVSFGVVHVGDTVQQALSVSNIAVNDGFSEKLNASFGGTSDARIITSGTMSLLVPGATNNSSLLVGLNTSAAGVVSGTATVHFQSDGTGTSGLGLTNLPSQNVGVSGDIQTTASVFRLAHATLHTPEPVTLGNVHVGTVATQALTIGNDALNDGFSEKLNGSMTTNTPGVITATGSFNLLPPGAPGNLAAIGSTSLVVGINTATAGAKSGTATISLQSDGTGTSGLGTTSLGTQTVTVSGNVFRLADPSAHTPEPVTFANVHVGDIAQQALSLMNTAANDGFSEKLNASLGGATAGITATGSFSLLGPQATNTTDLVVGLNTSTAGAKSGTATITLQSDGMGTSGLGTTALPVQTVSTMGNVFRLAQANTLSPVNFGVVHVGDTVQQALSISNTAANDSFSEKLNASFGATSDTRITTSGSISLLGPGGTDNSSMLVGLNTSAAGVVTGTATVHFQSDGTGTSGLGLTNVPSQTVPTILAQINNFASPAFLQTTGAGTFSGGGTNYQLDFGTITKGSSPLSAALSALNNVTGPADLLNGSFLLNFGTRQEFGFTGFTPFTNLNAGQSFAGLMVTFDPTHLGPGAFNDLVVLKGTGHNASGFSGALPDVSVHIQGTVDPNGVFDAIWNGGTGNYSIANKWDINTVPNNGVPPGSRYNVLIDGAKTGTASDVSLDINATINNLTIDAGDKLGINASKSLTIAGGTMTNSGSLLIETGSTFSLDNGATYTQTAGLTTVNGSLTATLDGITDVSIMGGTLAGTGTITADVLLSGMFSPGNSPGLLSIAGDYTQTRFGELDIEIGGLTAGSQFDQLRIGGLATLDGTLRINFLNGFAPSVGDSFEFLDFLGTHQGAFGTLTSNVPGIQFRIDDNGTNITLVVTQQTPEPATVLLMLSGLLGLLVSRRFVRRQQRRMQE